MCGKRKKTWELAEILSLSAKAKLEPRAIGFFHAALGLQHWKVQTRKYK